MKRLFTLLLASVMCASLLAGCGGRQTEGGRKEREKTKAQILISSQYSFSFYWFNSVIYFYIFRCKNQMYAATLPPVRRVVSIRTWRLPDRSSTMSSRMRTASSPIAAWGWMRVVRVGTV